MQVLLPGVNSNKNEMKINSSFDMNPWPQLFIVVGANFNSYEYIAVSTIFAIWAAMKEQALKWSPTELKKVANVFVVLLSWC